MNKNNSEIGIFPGGDGMNDYAWFDWLKNQLDKSGIDSYIAESKIISPLDRANYLGDLHPLNERSILVGHSFGALAAVKMAELSKNEIAGLLLVDPSVRDAFTVAWKEEDGFRIPYLESWDWQMDLEKVREKVGKIIILSDTDSGRNLHNWEKIHRDVYTKRLAAELRIVDAVQKHFSSKEEPAVWQAVMDLIASA